MSFKEDNERCKQEMRREVGTSTGDIICERGWDDTHIHLGLHNIATIEGRLARPCRVLEIGCGVGNALSDLAQEYPNNEYHGVDVCPGNFLSEPRINLHDQDAHALEFPDDHFDIIYSAIAFPYMAHKVRAIKEAHRVLAPKGQAYISLKPDYFVPEDIIPTDSTQSDVFWHRGVLRLNKRGRGLPFLGVHYRKCMDFPDDDLVHPLFSVISVYRT